MKGPEAWESVKINNMIRELQPHIIINDRLDLPEDYTTPEEEMIPAERGRDWEACMTFNGRSWGYMPSAACDAYTPRQILFMLNTCCAKQGNLLLNIGPQPDGSVPEESVKPLKTVGKWLAKEIGGRGVLDNAQSTLEVADDGSVSGNTAVNRYGGNVTMEGQKIKFGSLRMTRRAGPPTLMKQESRFMQALGKVAGFRIDDSTLKLLDSNGHVVVRLSKMAK